MILQRSSRAPFYSSKLDPIAVASAVVVVSLVKFANEGYLPMETSFSPITAAFGGALIGLAAVLLMFLNGRVAGISGIVGGIANAKKGDGAWRLAFVCGLLTAPFLYVFLFGDFGPITVTDSTPLLICGAVLVGLGTQMGSGCTSGHGVCGLARFSPRSLAATVTFMASAIFTVYIARHSGV